MGLTVPSIGRGTAYAYTPGSRRGDSRPDASGVFSGPSGPTEDLYIPSGTESPSFAPAYGPTAYTPRAPLTAHGPDAGNTDASSQGSSTAIGAPPSAKGPEAPDSGECRTCAERTYKDGSNDPGVSFKSATHVSPEAAAMAVSAHEGEHVAREQMKAKTDNKAVVSQVVQIHTAVCPECGRVYVSGGTTTTTTRSAPEAPRSQGIDVTV